MKYLVYKKRTTDDYLDIWSDTTTHTARIKQEKVDLEREVKSVGYLWYDGKKWYLEVIYEHEKNKVPTSFIFDRLVKHPKMGQELLDRELRETHQHWCHLTALKKDNVPTIPQSPTTIAAAALRSKERTYD